VMKDEYIDPTGSFVCWDSPGCRLFCNLERHRAAVSVGPCLATKTFIITRAGKQRPQIQRAFRSLCAACMKSQCLNYEVSLGEAMS